MLSSFLALLIFYQIFFLWKVWVICNMYFQEQSSAMQILVVEAMSEASECVLDSAN